MKVSASIGAALFGTAVLSGAVGPSRVARDPPSLVGRQIATITGILNDVNDGIEGLDSAVGKYDGGDSSPVVDAANDLVDTITSGVSTAKGSKDLTLEEALGLTGPVGDLTDTATKLVDDLKSKRSTLADAGECKTTRDLISGVNSSSNDLIDAVVSKVPEAAQSIADGLVADLKKVLKQAQDDFSETNCVDKAQPSTTAEPTGEPTGEPTTSEPAGEPTTSEPAGEPTTSEPAGEPTTTEPAVTPTGTPTGTPIVPPPNSGNGTETPTTGPPVVPTAGAAGLVPAGALALGFAVALL